MKKTFKSIGAVLAGIIAVFVLSTITDVILEQTGLLKLPFGTNPLWFIIAVVVYRTIYVVAGSYITATLAPDKPMKHSIYIWSDWLCVRYTWYDSHVARATTLVSDFSCHTGRARCMVRWEVES